MISSSYEEDAERKVIFPRAAIGILNVRYLERHRTVTLTISQAGINVRRSKKRFRLFINEFPAAELRSLLGPAFSKCAEK